MTVDKLAGGLNTSFERAGVAICLKVFAHLRAEMPMAYSRLTMMRLRSGEVGRIFQQGDQHVRAVLCGAAVSAVSYSMCCHVLKVQSWRFLLGTTSFGIVCSETESAYSSGHASSQAWTAWMALHRAGQGYAGSDGARQSCGAGWLEFGGPHRRGLLRRLPSDKLEVTLDVEASDTIDNVKARCQAVHPQQGCMVVPTISTEVAENCTDEPQVLLWYQGRMLAGAERLWGPRHYFASMPGHVPSHAGWGRHWQGGKEAVSWPSCR